jgi:very-short-patch-repair endonuclease
MTTFALACESIGLPTPEEEFRWHPSRQFRADYCWPEPMLILEVDGGVFGKGKPCPLCKRRQGGAHSSIKDILRDMERANAAAMLGWRFLRVTPDQMNDGTALTLVERALKGAMP